MDRGAWQAVVHSVATSWMRLKRISRNAHFSAVLLKDITFLSGGIGMGNTCKSMADSCQCMTKTTTIL